MTYKITGDKAVTVGTTKTEIDVGYRGFFIQNDSENTVYFRDAEYGDAGAGVGMSLAAGETFPHALTCKTISLKASAASSSVKLLFVDMG